MIFSADILLMQHKKLNFMGDVTLWSQLSNQLLKRWLYLLFLTDSTLKSTNNMHMYALKLSSVLLIVILIRYVCICMILATAHNK